MSWNASLLNIPEIRGAFKDKRPGDRFIFGISVISRKEIWLIRGDLRTLTIPFSFFTPNPTAKPDFTKFKMDEYGTEINLGEYCVSSRTILKSFDPEVKAYCKSILKQKKKIKRTLLEKAMSYKEPAPAKKIVIQECVEDMGEEECDGPYEVY